MNLRKHVSLNINIRGTGQSPFPVPTPVVNALKLYAHEKDYLPAKGLPALKEAVAGFHKAKDNVDANPDPLLNTLPVNMRHSFTAGMMKERP